MTTKLKLSLFLPLILCVALQAQDAAPAGAFAGRVSVNASLKTYLNSKNAKPGQSVVATLETPAIIGALNLPKGSTLTGHVVAVTKHTKETPNGSLTIVFEQAKPKKGGDPVNIRASVFKIMVSESMVLAQKQDTSGGMRGGAADSGSTALLRQNVDKEGRSVNGLQSDPNAPVQVISGVPGVALTATATDDSSGIMTAKNQDVELAVSLDMVIGVMIKP